MKQPKNTRTIGASMPPNQMFDMDKFMPRKIFSNPAYRAAPQWQDGDEGCTQGNYGTTKNSSMSGKINY